MAEFQVSWSAFGRVWVDAEDEEDAVDKAQDEVDEALSGVEYDGSDVGDYIYKQED